MMEKVLSKLARKPSKIDEQVLKRSGWYEARDQVFNHMENDPVLQYLIDKFNVVDDHIKLTRSTEDMKINFHVLENSRGHRYAYARTQFVINGTRKDFRKYLGKEGEVNLKNINLNKLRDYFDYMLKNYLEYHK